ncbi:hypothetical protein B0H13DRAFT_1927731 [Mycena leptocephala]|nr:hypothetical protein B0H13DRAFT_1927731 [Mycena leptocephala]
MPRTAKAIASCTKNLFKSKKKAPEKIVVSDCEDATMSAAQTSSPPTDTRESKANDSRTPSVKEIPDEGDCHRHMSADSEQPSADSECPPIVNASDIDPNLIEIIGRFDMIDDFAPESLEIDSDDEDACEDETEIQEITELEMFTSTLKHAQEIAVAREREQEMGRKRPHRYGKNSKGTQERRAKITGTCARKITKRDSATESAAPGAPSSQPQTSGSVPEDGESLPDNQGAQDAGGHTSESEEEEEENSENDADNDRHGQ